jgi:Holliday junction resolvasome RuvABC endonuclease subunit
MRVLAVDPGYDRLGLAVMDKINGKEALVYSCCVETNKKEAI